MTDNQINKSMEKDPSAYSPVQQQTSQTAVPWSYTRRGRHRREGAAMRLRESIEWFRPDTAQPPCHTNLLGVFDDADDNRWITVCYLDSQGLWHELSDSTYEGPQMWMLVHAPTLWAKWPEGPTAAE